MSRRAPCPLRLDIFGQQAGSTFLPEGCLVGRLYFGPRGLPAVALPNRSPSSRQLEGQMKTMLRWASALCILSVSTIASAGSLPPGGFRVGYNEGWIENNYGNWLADNPFFGSSAFNVGCTSGNNG